MPRGISNVLILLYVNWQWALVAIVAIVLIYIFIRYIKAKDMSFKSENYKSEFDYWGYHFLAQQTYLIVVIIIMVLISIQKGKVEQCSDQNFAINVINKNYSCKYFVAFNKFKSNQAAKFEKDFPFFKKTGRK